MTQIRALTILPIDRFRLINGSHYNGRATPFDATDNSNDDAEGEGRDRYASGWP
jgi:hypothetical protein